MPKKYKPATGDEIAFGIDAIRARPVLAQHMMLIIQQSSVVNVLLANALSLILHIEAKSAITMYTAITNDGAKTAAMRAIGNELLDTNEKKKEFEKILKKFGKYEVHRNVIAHGIWIAVKQHNDFLLYVNPADYIKWKSAINVAGAKDDVGEFIRLLMGKDVFYSSLDIYDEAEFKKIECMYDLLTKRVNKFAESVIHTH